MRLAGKPEDYFRAVTQVAQQFSGPRNGNGVLAGLGVVGAVGAVAGLPKRKPDKQVKKLVKQEVQKAIKAKQPAGLSFDLFG